MATSAVSINEHILGIRHIGGPKRKASQILRRTVDFGGPFDTSRSRAREEKLVLIALASNGTSGAAITTSRLERQTLLDPGRIRDAVLRLVDKNLVAIENSSLRIMLPENSAVRTG